MMKKYRYIVLPLCLLLIVLSAGYVSAQGITDIANGLLAQGTDEIVKFDFSRTFLDFSKPLQLIVDIGIYVFTSYALFKIAREEKNKLAWFAWVPILDMILVCKIINFKLILYFLSFFFFLLLLGAALLELPSLVVIGLLIITFVYGGAVILTVLSKLSVKRGYSGWFVVLPMLVPYVGFIIFYYFLAWKPKTNENMQQQIQTGNSIPVTQVPPTQSQPMQQPQSQIPPMQPPPTQPTA